ncbi:hypothetical protein JTE90_002539 [Oedothorax gibbosus]|uniref:Uncharacterized protein n=1 Tax=Oedothorax gibbosus TaxID=931172 RepID=A0AAV6V2D0_9ARAC|nr:hypothetical protein JTE90_002539 [Oedothorax gibbosus]
MIKKFRFKSNTKPVGRLQRRFLGGWAWNFGLDRLAKQFPFFTSFLSPIMRNSEGVTPEAESASVPPPPPRGREGPKPYTPPPPLSEYLTLQSIWGPSGPVLVGVSRLSIFCFTTSE